MAKSNPTTKEAVARIQSVTAKANDGRVPKGHFLGRMQRIVAKNTTQKGGK